MWDLLFSALAGGSGNKPGQASRDANAGMMQGLAGLGGGLGFDSSGMQTQTHSGGVSLNQQQIQAIMSLFGGKPKNPVPAVNPQPTGNWQEEMM